MHFKRVSDELSATSPKTSCYKYKEKRNCCARAILNECFCAELFFEDKFLKTSSISASLNHHHHLPSSASTVIKVTKPGALQKTFVIFQLNKFPLLA